jgi:uncharacterized protein
VKRLFIAVLAAYKRWLSPMLGPACKYQPTCSEYAMLAIDRWGVVAGTALAAWRVLRCNPFSRGGLDQVPERHAHPAHTH